MNKKKIDFENIKPREHRVGAPPGNTVHWITFELYARGGTFTKDYRLNYNDLIHNYRFSRYRARTLIDEFIVIRTSKRCFRVMYYNADYEHFIYFSAENYRDCAARMISIYQIFKSLEEAEERQKTPPETKNSSSGG